MLSFRHEVYATSYPALCWYIDGIPEEKQWYWGDSLFNDVYRSEGIRLSSQPLLKIPAEMCWYEKLPYEITGIRTAVATREEIL